MLIDLCLGKIRYRLFFGKVCRSHLTIPSRTFWRTELWLISRNRDYFYQQLAISLHGTAPAMAFGNFRSLHETLQVVFGRILHVKRTATTYIYSPTYVILHGTGPWYISIGLTVNPLREQETGDMIQTNECADHGRYEQVGNILKREVQNCEGHCREQSCRYSYHSSSCASDKLSRAGPKWCETAYTKI